MSQTNLKRLIAIVSSGMILIGLGLILLTVATKDDRNHIVVDLSGGKTQTVEFSELCLLPGGECSYNISLKNTTDASECDLILDFVELEEKLLKNFARVQILSKDTVICDELLATVFEDEGIVLPANFKTGDNTELTIVYYLPLDTGNEAKNAEAVFELRLTASNE